jgi:hypothetical protein
MWHSQYKRIYLWGRFLTGYAWEGNSSQHVIYNGTGRRIHELWLKASGGWNHTDLTTVAGAPGLRSRNFHPPAWEGWQRQFDADGFGVDADRQVVIFSPLGTG